MIFTFETRIQAISASNKAGEKRTHHKNSLLEMAGAREEMLRSSFLSFIASSSSYLIQLKREKRKCILNESKVHLVGFVENEMSIFVVLCNARTIEPPIDFLQNTFFPSFHNTHKKNSIRWINALILSLWCRNLWSIDSWIAMVCIAGHLPDALCLRIF